jgi:hypothetical protein
MHSYWTACPQGHEMSARAVVLAAMLISVASPSLAQQNERIGPWVADLRIASAGLPSEAGWTADVPNGTVVPSRGFGFEIGAQVNVLRLRALALGVGATWLVARGSSTAPEPTGTPAGPAVIPDMSTRVTALTPQVSLNFGHSLGWSYVSAGLGRSRTESEATLAGAPLQPRDSDWVKTLNYGGGARWFLNDRLGVGFDIRWHKVSLVPADATHPGAPRASLIVAGAGIVVK